ncbi:hypothetical protein KL930_000554 [Ogataea haglerorum]|uniref:Uncharacterized protein n=1 Tax=Ogataea haglerorum TaxID=1937702 RepID=A0AAN6D4W2_9ASCO|nr:uncharacterized protein KL911_000576 [Ogataea haglerorum]KAG7693542.1 hypothetical protein KL951_004563 [Ogataea haglerorum]KAG7706101.1 hypothetical protein KL950_003677 [Ogataea haglerorum]KAG7708951.1 hypothetical protein KL914_001341 [Ogataea haglerorum]KAG7725708.1 hypothetical protein KL948_004892 [Ogataea haglerorum]KAG7726732.1 hypothetical protein KL933_003015 [Ogataea haglerorum]
MLPAESVASTPQLTRRISRRSISKHSQPFKDDPDALEWLRRKLDPEWEIDVRGELDDDDDGIEELLNGLRASKRINTLQEYRFLSTLNPQLESFDYQAHYEKFANFQSEIKNTRTYLKPLFDYLQNFEHNINKLSQEMEFLQKRSDMLNLQIKSKQELDTRLTPVINDLIIPPAIINSIIDDKIDEKWVENIAFLAEKKEIYSKYSSETQPKCLPELVQLLDLMELKVVERIRDYLIKQIKALRKQTVSSQVVQSEMLEVKEIFTFLQEKNRKLSNDLCQAYCHTMRWYYYQNFVKYTSSLERLRIHKVEKNVLLGALEEEAGSSGAGSFFGYSNKRHEITASEYLIGLTKRLELLGKFDETVMPAQIAETNNAKYWLETAFRNFNVALLDNVSVEYLFMSEFFNLTKSEQLDEIFKTIFNPVYQIGHSFTKYLISNTYDYFGVLIAIRLTQQLEYELQRRRIPVMEDYLNYQLIILWPRFQNLIDQNCMNVKKSVSSSVILKSINKNIMIPLDLTQNFGRVLLNLLGLSQNLIEQETSEPLTNSIVRLRNEFESTLMKMSSTLDPKKREIFLYSNFSLVLTILSELEEPNKTGLDEVAHFQNLVDAYASRE